MPALKRGLAEAVMATGNSTAAIFFSFPCLKPKLCLIEGSRLYVFHFTGKPRSKGRMSRFWHDYMVCQLCRDHNIEDTNAKACINS